MEVASLNVKIIGELPKVYMEGTLYLWMSLLKKESGTCAYSLKVEGIFLHLLLKSGRDLTPTP
jgi:hypothetical protein